IMNLKALVPPAVAGVETPPGYGVNVSAIERIKSEFYDSQIRQSLSQRDYWAQLGDTFVALEVIFLEPGDTGINTYLSEFFDAWQELSTNPESYAARVSLVEQSETLSKVIREIYNNIDDLCLDTEKELDDCLSEINVLAGEIASINERIVFFQSLGTVSNELLDERDLRIEQLSRFIDVQVRQKDNGAVEVVAGGRTLLHDDLFFPLEKVSSFNEGSRERVLSIKNDFGFELKDIQGGKLKGLLESFNETLPEYRAAMDDLAYNLVQEVNKLHREGYGLNGETGYNFFEPWADPMPGDIIIDMDGEIVSLDFPKGAADKQKLLDGTYRLDTQKGFVSDSGAEVVSSYSRNGQALVESVYVADSDNKINSSIIFEVVKLDGEEISLSYKYLHTKVNDDGILETVSGNGLKKLTGQSNNEINFGGDEDWALKLNIILEDVQNFSTGDKFIIQVAAEGNGGDKIELHSINEDGEEPNLVFAIAAGNRSLQGKQELKFFQLDEKTGKENEVTLFMETEELMAETETAIFEVGPFSPEHPREYIYRAAANFRVNPALFENMDAVAAAKIFDSPGDGNGALDIYRLREKLLEGLEETSFEDFFRGRMANLGVQGREAQRLEFNMNAIYENMSEQAESVAGVSLDDEMLGMVQYQHAYNASAQFLSIIDEMLETLINGIR
ncbi:MAG TPA: flagellar hook-associated protein FlgK, partial [Firmicutes bacterium]|nr:flagellar hook-associated protein FlgK [Bacillota bacterium]